VLLNFGGADDGGLATNDLGDAVKGLDDTVFFGTARCTVRSTAATVMGAETGGEYELACRTAKTNTPIATINRTTDRVFLRFKFTRFLSFR
jgi:hypothetical protein